MLAVWNLRSWPRIAGLRANDTSSGSRQASDVRQARVGLITLKFPTRRRTLSKRLVSPCKSSINSDGINEPPIEGIYDGIGVYPGSFSDGGMHEPSSGTAI